MKKALFTLALTLVAFTGNAQLVINGDLNYDGDLNITDVMKMVDIILGNSPKSYLTCPDDNHPHLIDLGLPSGTKWACCNVADDPSKQRPTYYGGYYAWGETSEKEVYSDVTYQYCTGEDADGDGWYDIGQIQDQDLGDNIAGTQYDVARVRWGDAWKMPSLVQIDELFQICCVDWTEKDGVVGETFTGPNGCSIFMPGAGYRWGNTLMYASEHGYYWSSTKSPDTLNGAYGLAFYSGGMYWNDYINYSGRSVRPVSR